MDIKTLRGQISEIDNKLLELMVDRMKLIEEIAACKRELGMEIFDPAQEAEKLRAATVAGGDSYGKYTRELMEQLMSISRDYQGQLRQK